MKIFRKVIRLSFLVLLIALACSGIGLPLINYREKYLDNEIKVELVEKRDDEHEDQLNNEEEKKN